ncbi:NADP-dependent phosphogluconate dehydrogenase [Clostridium sp. AL.422]|nr:MULTISPECIES: NADP-dependent phosphogluconate dehydrogenase [unclassified Clostridium]MDV4149890.1 NADP-dependent phosphogluconate dehydrogenase [Clostridium sp. AL.422]
MNKSKIGVIGMAVMGRSIALNMADHGFKVSVYNRSKELTDEAIMEDETGNLKATYSLEELIDTLEKPRNILLMIKSGDPVDKIIAMLLPLLDKGDLIIDGGNSYFKDTIRRAKELENKEIHFFGMGVSGGEEGARRGPAIMPGGDKAAYERVKDVLEAISAKASDGDPCCKYTSRDGAGHYVKMVHNGIEYADMQIIAEGYSIMKNVLKMSNEEMADTFERYNLGPLDSYLIEITRDILREKDHMGEGYLVDKILDTAKQKGTGKWTNLEAIDLGVNTSILLAGLNSRIISSQKDERKVASKILSYEPSINNYNKEEVLKDIEDALLASKIMSYAQGFTLLKEAAKVYNWDFDNKEIASIFRAGCIIRSQLLYAIMDEFEKNNDLNNLMISDNFSKILNERTKGLRRVVKIAVEEGISVPALMESIGYFDGYRTERSAANLVQGQRDYFGAHTYERIDVDGVFHNKWS